MDSENPRLAGVDPDSRRDVWIKKLLYPAHTVPTAAAPVLVGIGLALDQGVFAPGPAVAVFVFGWLVQLGGVLADNYFNLRRYHNDSEHPALVHALESGILTLDEIKRVTIGVFTLGAVVGGYLVLVGGVPVIVVGLASIAVSLLYSIEVTDIPLHDVYFFLFFGPISVGGAFYIQAVADVPFPTTLPPGSLPAVAVIAGVPVGTITAAILVVDNIRDLEFDRDKDDPTLAVVIGERWSRIEYYGLLAVAYLIPIGLWGLLGDPLVLLPMLSLPYAVMVAKRLGNSRTYIELLPMSPATGRTLLMYSALLGLGFGL